jgi:hypothetical protein
MDHTTSQNVTGDHHQQLSGAPHQALTDSAELADRYAQSTPEDAYGRPIPRLSPYGPDDSSIPRYLTILEEDSEMPEQTQHSQAPPPSPATDQPQPRDYHRQGRNPASMMESLFHNMQNTVLRRLQDTTATTAQSSRGSETPQDDDEYNMQQTTVEPTQSSDEYNMQQTTIEPTQSSEHMDEPLDYDDFHEDTPAEQREQRRRPLRATKKPKPFESYHQTNASGKRNHNRSGRNSITIC